MAEPVVLDLPATASQQEIQLALDHGSSGGEVRLGPGTFVIRDPIFLRTGHAALCGTGGATVLYLADHANCPVLVLGAPLAPPSHATVRLRLSDLVIDGNRKNQQAEFWRTAVDGSALMNNGIDVWNVADASISHVVCRHCRSGGLVTAGGTRRLMVSDFTAFDDEFDGLACYQTEESRFTKLFLHDNPGAGISLDLAFNHNRIEDAELDGNDLGIFMRHSRDNTFEDIRVRHCRHDGIFIAQSLGRTPSGWGLAPGTECIDNSFSRLDVANCGGRPVWINNVSCVNNRVTNIQLANLPIETAQPARTLTAVTAPALNSAGLTVTPEGPVLKTRANSGSIDLRGVAGASAVVPTVGSVPRIVIRDL